MSRNETHWISCLESTNRTTHKIQRIQRFQPMGEMGTGESAFSNLKREFDKGNRGFFWRENMVPEGGVEPPRVIPRQILSLGSERSKTIQNCVKQRDDADSRHPINPFLSGYKVDTLFKRTISTTPTALT